MTKADNKPVTLINVFFVEPEDQERLVSRLTDVTDAYVRSAPGFLGSKLHRSFDGSKVVMYAKWESQDAYRASRENPVSVEQLKDILSFAVFEPGVYDVIATFAPEPHLEAA
jgi:heme-degrading monooxygenase HmoA